MKDRSDDAPALPLALDIADQGQLISALVFPSHVAGRVFVLPTQLVRAATLACAASIAFSDTTCPACLTEECAHLIVARTLGRPAWSKTRAAIESLNQRLRPRQSNSTTVLFDSLDGHAFAAAALLPGGARAFTVVETATGFSYTGTVSADWRCGTCGLTRCGYAVTVRRFTAEQVIDLGEELVIAPLQVTPEVRAAQRLDHPTRSLHLSTTWRTSSVRTTFHIEADGLPLYRFTLQPAPAACPLCDRRPCAHDRLAG